MSEINEALIRAARERKKVAESEEAVPSAFAPAPDIPVSRNVFVTKKKRFWPFLALWLVIALTGALAFWFYSSWEAEKTLRTEREAELSRKTEELAEKQDELSQLTQEKKELEDQFYANVAALEETTKNYEDKVKNLSEKIESLKNENNSLKNINDSLVGENKALKIENTAKDGNIAELFQKLALSEQQE